MNWTPSTMERWTLPPPRPGAGNRLSSDLAFSLPRTRSTRENTGVEISATSSTPTITKFTRRLLRPQIFAVSRRLALTPTLLDVSPFSG